VIRAKQGDSVRNLFVSAGIVAMSIVCVNAYGDPLTLCHAQERVVFSCPAGKKIVSLCATGDLHGSNGVLTYRFGADASHVELDYHARPQSSDKPFSYDEQIWAKGAATAVTFFSGAYTYTVAHRQGAYGVEGGPNTAYVQVFRDIKPVATVSCSEPDATDHMYQELHDLHLPAAGVL
jgi:hypothetical protein